MPTAERSIRTDTDRHGRSAIWVLLLFAAVAVSSAEGAAGQGGVLQTQNTDALPPYEVFELTFQHDGRYANPFFDVVIDVTFTSPSRRRFNVGGFHYGSLKPPTIRVAERRPNGSPRRFDYVFARADTWKARFAPAEIGRWTYEYVFRDTAGLSEAGEGSFMCVTGRVHNHGFVRQNPANAFRWVFDDGTPYFPIGLQEGWGDWAGIGTALAGKAMEGPFRTDRTHIVELPPGPLYVRGPSMGTQNADVYARRYRNAGFNLYRFSQRNNTYDLYRDLDHYLVQEAIMTDEILQHMRKYGFCIFYGLFGYQKVFNDEPENAEAMAKVKRFIKYSVDRWGAYVDFWQFLNEQHADDRWYAIMAPYLRSIDPYRHPITTSWQRPALPGIEINAPHWYQTEDEFQSDAVTASRAAGWKRQGKPVIVGEQGNRADRKKPRPPGIGGVWDAGSARRMRIRTWTALFSEITFVFWNTSYARDGHYMNIWLGPQEREYVRALQGFANRLDADLRIVPVEVSRPAQVRAYGLSSARLAAVYLHHFTDHTRTVEGVVVSVDVPVAGTAYWYSPSSAEIASVTEVSAGRRTFEAPPFAVDMALLITPDGPPDIDGDAVPNDVDLDDDNDGVPDQQDAFPLEPEEWSDRDRDLIGDNLDADLNGDGIGDDRNRNGTPDCEELDLDGDGVPRSGAVPWDAFPDDPKEWRDTDGDGIGDRADADDDGDGWDDTEERQAGTDPLNKLSFPAG